MKKNKKTIDDILKELPENMKGEHLNVSAVHLPQGGPTRYSAYHGYAVA